MGQPPAPVTQLQQVLNPLQAPGTNRRNYLVNGGFEVWQRGTGPFVTNGAYWADRWRADIGINPVTQVDFHRVSSTISLGAPSGYAASLGVNLGVGGLMRVGQQIMPGDTLDQLRGRVMTFSARVLPNTLNSIRPVVVGGVMGSTTNPFNTTNVAQTMWCTFTVPSNETSLYVGFEMANASSVSQVDEAMLVIGSVPADYFPEHPADEMARCNRYYETWRPQPTLWSVAQYLTSGGSGWVSPYQFKAVKPVTPTISRIGTWTTSNCSAPTGNGTSLDGFGLTTGVTATGMFSFMPADANAYFAFEANP